MEWLLIIASGIVWGCICQAVGSSKNVNGFWWGFFLGFIGLIIVLCLKGNDDIEEIVVTTDDSSNNKLNKYDQIEKLAKLRGAGALTEEEFNKEKSKLLDD